MFKYEEANTHRNGHIMCNDKKDVNDGKYDILSRTDEKLENADRSGVIYWQCRAWSLTVNEKNSDNWCKIYNVQWLYFLIRLNLEELVECVDEYGMPGLMCNDG